MLNPSVIFRKGIGRRNGKLLQYVPEGFKTAELCRIAVRNCADAFKHVPEHLRTLELCMEAAQ